MVSPPFQSYTYFPCCNSAGLILCAIDAADGTDETAQDSGSVDADRGEKTAENVRYGQNISESGVGGFTNTSEGTANQEGGYGGTKAQEELEGNQSGNAEGRTEQGYSAKDGSHDYSVGG